MLCRNDDTQVTVDAEVVLVVDEPPHLLNTDIPLRHGPLDIALRHNGYS